MKKTASLLVLSSLFVTQPYSTYAVIPDDLNDVQSSHIARKPLCVAPEFGKPRYVAPRSPSKAPALALPKPEEIRYVAHKSPSKAPALALPKHEEICIQWIPQAPFKPSYLSEIERMVAKDPENLRIQGNTLWRRATPVKS
jgi:hypothetical protein